MRQQLCMNETADVSQLWPHFSALPPLMLRSVFRPPLRIYSGRMTCGFDSDETTVASIHRDEGSGPPGTNCNSVAHCCVCGQQ